MTGSFAPNARTSKDAVYTKKGVVAAQNAKAAQVGAGILDAGGNAIDAAIATSFALAATEPWMSGLGGGGSAVCYHAANATYSTFDFNMLAPRALDPSAYPLDTSGSGGDLFGWPAVVGDVNVKGPLSIAVPGQLAGIALLHERGASMPIAELVAPAIDLAKAGLEIDWFASFLISTAARDLHRDATCRQFYLQDGFAPVPDWTGHPLAIRLGNLASTLEELAREGLASYYTGSVAEALLLDLQDVGSVIQRADLENYQAFARKPLQFSYRDARVAAMDGLYAGPSLRMALGEVAAIEPAGDWPDEHEFLAYAQGLNHSYRYRLEHMGEAADPKLNSCTSHHCAIDAEGNMVSMTQTLLSLFGSKVMLPRTGVLMNNGIMWFDPRPSRPNSIAPGRKPLSNMCPIIAETADFRLALGASGGRRIMPAVMQILCSIVDHGMSLEEAFAQPRIDVSGSEEVVIDERLWDPIPEALAAHYSTRRATAAPYPLSFACPSGIMHDLLDGYRYGTAEISQPWADAVAQA